MNKTISSRRQRGASFWSFAGNVFLLGVFLLIILRIAPAYMEYLTIKDIIERAAQEYDPERNTIQDVHVRVRKLLLTNQVYDFKVEDIEIFRERGRIVIDANYERRFPLLWIVDGVMTFDDLIVETELNRD